MSAAGSGDSKSGGTYRYLIADIGGTNSRVQLYEVLQFGTSDGDTGAGGWRERLIHENVYPSAPASHLNAILLEFLAACKCTRNTAEWPQAACLAVAGPVQRNTCFITNLAHWNVLDGEEMSKTLGLQHCVLVNDFVAIGYGLLALDHSPGSKDLHVLKDAPRVAGAPKACIGAGTGLGETFLTCPSSTPNGYYDVWPSEGGHADFAPRTALEFELQKFLLHKESIDRCSIERVVSGPGIRRVYEFLCKSNPLQVSPVVTEALRKAEDAKKDLSAVIASFALPATDAEPNKVVDDLCLQAINTFIHAYAAEAGNVALKQISYGGMYIAGGIAPKILPLMLKDGAFLKTLTAKGRMKELLNSVPVYIVTHPQVGLLGAQVMCRRLLLLRSVGGTDAKHTPHVREQYEATLAAVSAAAGKSSAAPAAAGAPATATTAASAPNLDAFALGQFSERATRRRRWLRAGLWVGGMALAGAVIGSILGPKIWCTSKCDAKSAPATAGAASK